MSNYKTITISPLELRLDTKNPRFVIPPNASQENARNYLFENEDITTLAKDIINFGGLMPGERIIVCKENGEFVVLEGNRRICVCQLILNPELIPTKYKTSFTGSSKAVIDSITSIAVDVAFSRESAQIVLARRHIDGPKRWSPISKKKFFSSYFESGVSIDQISVMTDTKKSEIIKDIKDYLLLLYAINLSVWTNEQKSKYLNLIKIKIDPFLRLFSAKSKQLKINANELLKINYDTNTLLPKSELNKEIFDKAIYLIAKSVFIDKVVDTRKSIEHVPGLLELINNEQEDEKEQSEKEQGKENSWISLDNNKINLIQENFWSSANNSKINQGKEEISVDKKSDKYLDNQRNDPQNNSQISNSENKQKDNQDNNNENFLKGSSKQLTSPKPVRFFANLTWSTIDEKNPENTGLIACAIEIQQLSKCGHYAKYTIATALLLRSLIEHSLKYYARKNGFWTQIKKNPNDNDPKLEAIIKYYNNHLTIRFPQRDDQRLFDSIFNNSGLKPFLDLIVHQPHITRATKETLDSIANGGVFAFINFILNS